MLQNLQNDAKFQNFQLDNLVDFEKCCKTRIFLQKSVPIQPKTSEILPKICQKLATTLRVRGHTVEEDGLDAGGGSLLDLAAFRRLATGAHHEDALVGLGLGKLAKLAKLCKFWRARSRLYQNEFLQENMRLAAFFKLYKICALLNRCNLKISTKNRFEKSAIFVKIWQY